MKPIPDDKLDELNKLFTKLLAYEITADEYIDTLKELNKPEPEQKKTLRLIYTDVCNRNCEGCCNKDFDLPNLPRPTHFEYDEIFITGGEPMLFLDEVIGFIKALRLITKAKIYIYTAYLEGYGANDFLNMLHWVDGITLTLHEPRDWQMFLQLQSIINYVPEVTHDKSLRLNIFKGVETDIDLIPNYWRIKDNIEWIKDCPLPPNEVLMKVY